VVLNLFLPRCTLSQLFQYLAGPLDAKIGLNVNKIDNQEEATLTLYHPSVLWHAGQEPL